MIETLEDIIEQLADKLGIYGAHQESEQKPCRCCWTASLRCRIDDAVEIDRKLNA